MCVLNKVKDFGTMDISTKLQCLLGFFRKGLWLDLTFLLAVMGDAFSKALLAFLFLGFRPVSYHVPACFFRFALVLHGLDPWVKLVLK